MLEKGIFDFWGLPFISNTMAQAFPGRPHILQHWRTKIQLEFCWEQVHLSCSILFDKHLPISFFSRPLTATVLFSALIILSVWNDTHNQCYAVCVSLCLAFWNWTSRFIHVIARLWHNYVLFFMIECCSVVYIWKFVPRFCPFWVAITEPLKLGNLWRRDIFWFIFFSFICWCTLRLFLYYKY